MTAEQYKQMSIAEFSKAADVYESGHAGVYNMCKKDYPDILAELEKEPFADLLDCGCGTAPVISLLYEKYPDKHYTGCASSGYRLRLADKFQKRYPDIIRKISAYLRKL